MAFSHGRIGEVAMDKRKFLKRMGLVAVGAASAGGIYPFLEAKWCHVARRTIALPNLPLSFRGATVRCWPTCTTGRSCRWLTSGMSSR